MGLEQGKRQARAVLANTIPRAARWRQQYAKIQRDLEALIEDAPLIQRDIARAAQAIMRSVPETEAPFGIYAQQDAGQSIPSELMAMPEAIQEAWRQAGGTNPNLDILPHVAERHTVAGQLHLMMIGHLGFVYRVGSADVGKFLRAMR